MMSLSAHKDKFHKSLDPIYGPGEVKSLFGLCCEHYLSLNNADQLLNMERTLSSSESVQLDKVLLQLELQKPIQYEMGFAYFCGLKLLVNQSVLIPRQETEELVDWILKDCPDDRPYQIADLCTGSGCIALALKSNRKSANLYAFDISKEAIELAIRNCNLLELEVNFQLNDVLNDDYLGDHQFDVIVSNPPYVLESEKSLMSKNVVNHEPHLALFVPNDDPLVFYRAIAQSAFKALKTGGSLYFEINETKGNAILELLTNTGFEGTVIKNDLNGKMRMVKCFKPFA